MVNGQLREQAAVVATDEPQVHTPPTGVPKACVACGVSLDVRAELCPRCGVRQPWPRAHASRRTAAMLAFFLGDLGIHKFYLGQRTWGVVYLLMCWTFWPLIIGVLESLWLLSMSDADFARRFPKLA
jgi:TM2 domain-containing membrane protein YozV